MKKLTILWLSLLSISGCSTLNIYDSKNNNPITKITSEKINNENRLIGLTNYTITDTNTGGIESYYSLKSGDKKIEARYETDKAGKSKITGLGLDIKPEPGSSHDIYQAIPLNSKNELNAILADLKSLKVDDNAKKEELQILINLIEGKEVAFYLERINLMAEKTFIEFKPLNLPKEFNLSIKEP